MITTVRPRSAPQPYGQETTPSPRTGHEPRPRTNPYLWYKKCPPIVRIFSYKKLLMKVKNNFSFYSTPKLLIRIKKNCLQYLQPGMGEMENIGNIEIKNYHISF